MGLTKFEKYHDVKLITDKYKSKGVSKGDIGAIVEIYDQNPKLPVGYDIAFTNPETGKDYALIIVHEEDIEQIN